MRGEQESKGAQANKFTLRSNDFMQSDHVFMVKRLKDSDLAQCCLRELERRFVNEF